jgi:predicted nucleic acid-binding protein
VTFLDTNIFIRYLTGDDPPRAQRCLNLFRALAHGAKEATSSEAIVAEVVFVLAGKTRYGQSRAQIRDGVLPLVLAPGLLLSDRGTIAAALELYAATSLDFADAVAAAHVINRGLDAVMSYDREFDTIPGLRREEP